MDSLIGKRCAVEFFDHMFNPCGGSHVVVVEVAMPMVSMHSIHDRSSVWVNAATIKTIRELGW